MGANSSKHSSVADQLTAAILRGDARFVQSIASKEIKRGFPFLHTAVIASHQSSNHELLQLILCLMSANGEPGDVFKLEKIVDQRRSEDGATPLMLACEVRHYTLYT